MTSSPENPASASPENPASADVKTRQSLQLDVLKISALGGALLYGVLFLGYYNYYRQLGLRPEDVGVSYTYILVRSIGFIVLMLLVLGAMAVIYLAVTAEDDDATPEAKQKKTRLWILGGALFGLFLAMYLTYLFPQNWPDWAGWLFYFVFFGLIPICRRIVEGNRKRGNVTFAALALLVTIVLPTAAVITRANALAHQVLAGHSIGPYEVFGVPILDVSAGTVTVTWIGRRDQQPAIFSKNSSEPIRGLFLGIESDAIVLMIANHKNHHIVRIPSALVIVEEN